MALHVVIGPPASGKTTYIREHAKHGDVVVDYDALAQALTVDGDSHSHPKHVASVAHQARNAAIAKALRYCGDVDVWIIHTRPRPEAMEKYANYGAKVITIDPGHDVVISRAQGARSDAAVAEAERWYEGEQPSSPTHVTHSEGSREW